MRWIRRVRCALARGLSAPRVCTLALCGGRLDLRGFVPSARVSLSRGRTFGVNAPALPCQHAGARVIGCCSGSGEDESGREPR